MSPDSKSKDRPAGTAEPVSKRFVWAELTPFPDNPPVSPVRIAKMMRDHDGYNRRVVGTPVVADNKALAFPDPPETVFILDGNNRRAMAEEAGCLREKIIAQFWTGLTRAEMHELCLGANDRRTPKPAERFLRRVLMGDPRLKKIQEIVEEQGWMVSFERQNGALSCTDELEWIYAGGTKPSKEQRPHRKALVRAIETYEVAFGMEAVSQQNAAIKGLGAFWLLYLGEASQPGVLRALEGLDVRKLYEAGRERRESENLIGIHAGMADVIRARYNKYRRSGR